MPVYEFICEECGAHFEKKMSFSENSSQVLCALGHFRVRKVLAHPSVVFKGSGWYSTDHRSRESSHPSEK